LLHLLSRQKVRGNSNKEIEESIATDSKTIYIFIDNDAVFHRTEIHD
jgi:hypothetical protein